MVQQAIQSLTMDELTGIGLSAVIAQAARLARDPELNKWKDVYEPAKALIGEMELSAGEYQDAIARLTEAMGA